MPESRVGKRPQEAVRRPMGLPKHPLRLSVQVTDALGFTATVACSISIGGSVTPAAPFGGSKQLPVVRPPNCFDDTLWAESIRLRKIQFPPLCSIPEEYRCLLPWDDTFGAVPKEAVAFHQAKGILTPAAIAGDQLILSMRVPIGYDGLLAGIFQIYTGSNFVPGSGDIEWRIQVDQHYVKDFGQSLYSLGSPQEPLPMTEGMILWSGQTVRYICNVPNLSGMIQVGQSQIVAGLLGFFWPR